MIFDESYGINVSIDSLYTITCDFFSKINLVYGENHFRVTDMKTAVAAIRIKDTDTVEESIEKNKESLFKCLPQHNNSGTRKTYGITITKHSLNYVIKIYDETGFDAVRISLIQKSHDKTTSQQLIDFSLM